jgi:hypothetical protein
MPSEITNNIGLASGALASNQVPTPQPRTAEAVSPEARVAESSAAAQVSSTQPQSGDERAIQRQDARSEGGFDSQERPKDLGGGSNDSAPRAEPPKKDSSQLNTVA